MTLREELDALCRTAGVPAAAAVRVTSTGVGEVAWSGVRRIDRADEVAAADRFHIGSNAKAMTATIVARAVERGPLTWDTRTSAVLGVGAPTLHQLLAHAAGLHPYGEDEQIDTISMPDGTPSEQRAAVARHVLAEVPLHPPGSAHGYSNAGPTVAAAMVEAVTGEPWEAAVRTEVFDPLGIDGRVGWPVLHDAAAPLGHRLRDGGLEPHDPATDPYALPPAFGPAGDVSLSIGDYGVFLADQLAGLRGKGRLGSREMYRTLHAPDPPDAEDDVRYALGWGVREGPNGPISQHTGSAETFYAVVVLETERDRGMAVVVNAYGDDIVRATNALVKAFLLA
jgi:CubicO group peptidase (beta-lactamase class C family)